MADDQAKKLDTIIEKLKQMDQKLDTLASKGPAELRVALPATLDEKTLRHVLEEYGLRKV
jgi:hypothetical protein